MHPEEPASLESLAERVTLLEKKCDSLVETLDERLKSAANDLRQDDSFMRPAAEKFTDHASDHLVTKLARKVFYWLLAFIGGAVTLWAGSTHFWKIGS